MRIRILLVTAAFSLAILAPSARAADEATCSGGAGEYPEGNSAYAYTLRALADLSRNLAGYKSDADVDRYIACWTRPPSKTYANEYRKLVKAAADASGVPFAILACLFFRESRWNPTIKSDAVPPAVGIAQLRPDTWAAMTSRLTGSVGVKNAFVPNNLRLGVKKDGKELDLLVRKVEALYAKSYRKPHGISEPEDLERLKEWLLAYQKLRKSTAAGGADEYLSNVDYALKSLEIRKAYQAYVGKTGRKPAAMAAANASASIIVGALYLRSVVFPGVFEKDYRYKIPSHDRWIIAVGGYNTGPGGSRCDAEMSMDRCIQVTAARENERHENSRHMTAVRNCSEQGNRTPMPGDSGKGCE